VREAANGPCRRPRACCGADLGNPIGRQIGERRNDRPQRLGVGDGLVAVGLGLIGIAQPQRLALAVDAARFRRRQRGLGARLLYDPWSGT
jgi:hypothetical protein